MAANTELLPLRYMRKTFSLLLKQVLDYLAAIVLLILLSPILALIALLIKLDSPGNVFYTQTRLGRSNKPFTIYKFRTMITGADKISLEIYKNDQRITKVGRFLRFTSLDELPQIFNVLRGDMSFVGPRPLLPGTIKPEEQRRQAMKPGFTSYPVLFGRNGLDWDERMQLDIWYVDHWNLWLDFKILIFTIPQILSKENVQDRPFRPGSSIK